MGTHAAILVGLTLYACVMLAVSMFWMTRVKKATDYLVAGRGLPWWILLGTITATSIGTGVVIGASGLAYQHGWAGCAYPLGLGLGTLLVGLFYAVMRRHRFITLCEEIACYYGGNRVVLEVSNLSLFVSQLCWLTVQIMGGGDVLGVVTGWNPKLCVLLAGLIVAVISIPGGLRTVVYTDFVQALILLGGFGVLIWSSLMHTGGLAGLRQAVPAPYNSFLGMASYGRWKVAGLIVVMILSVVADPNRRLTMYGARSEKGIRWGMAAAGLIVMLFSVVVGIIGMYVFTLNAHLSKADQALPWLVIHALPPWLAALVVVAVTSAIFSSANGSAAAAGTFFVRHVYPLMTGRQPDRPLELVRRTLVCAFVLSTVLALYTGGIVDFVVKFLPLTMSGLAVIILLGRFWNRATWQGALAALAVTPAVALTVMFIPSQAQLWNNPTIPATLAGLLVHVVVSLLTPGTKRSLEEVACALSHERRTIEEDLPRAKQSSELAHLVRRPTWKRPRAAAGPQIELIS
ncbi:MAG: sodium:solute symporter family protein [Verrucomicrobiota bacterium]|nr:sodium:solute symporter family protein [Verrucomicrobiota bacterium]